MKNKLLNILIFIFCYGSAVVTPIFAQPSELTVLENKLKEAEKNKNTVGICQSFSDIGDFYFQQDELKKASKYYKRYLNKSEDYKILSGVADAKNKIGTVLVKKADYEEAMSFFEQALTIAETNNFSELRSKITSNINNVKEKLALQKKINEKYTNIKSMKKEDVVRLLEEENIKQREAEISAYELAVKQKKVKLEQYTFLEKIKNLSTENQLIAMRLEYKQHEIEKSKLEIDKSKLKIDVLQKESELKNIIIAKKEIETQVQRNIIWFSSILIIFLLILALIIYKNFAHKKKSNRILKLKNKQIEKKNTMITESIMYAKKIQDAFLASTSHIKDVFNEYFILYKPKDIVSGDFYWTSSLNDRYVIWLVGDCTGHGVPGAFMCIIGNSLLNEIVLEHKIISADAILNELRSSIIRVLGQAKGEVKDGIDAALCVWDKETNKLEFAGAFNPLYLIRDGELKIVEGDKKTIGWNNSQKESSFTKNEIQLKKGDTIFLFSDGYFDQFGGESGKKFSKKRFNNLLIAICNKPLEEQKLIIDDTFEKWRAQRKEAQVDDICIMGVRI